MIIVYLKMRITTFKGIDKTSSANQALFKWYTIEMPCIYSYVMCCNSSHQYTSIQLCDVFVFQLTSIYSYVMLMLLVVSSIFIGISDPDFSQDGYFWMCIHIITTGQCL